MSLWWLAAIIPGYIAGWVLSAVAFVRLAPNNNVFPDEATLLGLIWPISLPFILIIMLVHWLVEELT